MSYNNNVTDLLPTYTLTPLPPLLPFVSDNYLILIVPVVLYWAFGLLFHWFNHKGLFPQYRIHTPAEFELRNKVSTAEVVWNVARQQLVNLAFGIALMSPEAEMRGREEYDIAVWATRLRMVQQMVPKLLALAGIDAKTWATHLSHYPLLAGAFAGNGGGMGMNNPVASEFASWELFAGSLMYWYIIPALQFGVAIFIADSWQYFCHRILHQNQWLYTHLHSVHHRYYVPHPFGSVYNHWAEAFVVDTIGTTVTFVASGLSTRQALWFLSLSAMKSVDDHCGYSLPWDPFQWLNEQNTMFHDIHHQNWGIKKNFSQVYTTFWDHALGTLWMGDNLSERYEQGRVSAEQWAQNGKNTSKTTYSGLKPKVS